MKVFCTLWHEEDVKNDVLLLPNATSKEEEMKIITEFTIELAKQRTIEEIIKASNYDEVNFLIKEGIRRKRLSMRDETPGKRRIVVLGIDDNISSQEVLAEARRMGLSRPTYGDTFLLGEKYPDKQNSGLIVFLHDPQYSWSGYFFDLFLDISSKDRIISMVSSGGSWHSGFLFAFRGR